VNYRKEEERELRERERRSKYPSLDGKRANLLSKKKKKKRCCFRKKRKRNMKLSVDARGDGTMTIITSCMLLLSLLLISLASRDGCNTINKNLIYHV